MPKIISYNVNGIRAAMTKGLSDWIKHEDADIICFQETKAQPDQIPQIELEALGYHSYWFSAVKKGYSGVGILSRIKPDHVEYGMGIEKYDYEGRVIRADYGDTSVISVYHPSGSSGEDRQAFKMIWLDDFLGYISELRKTRPKLIISGDYNICHTAIDIHDPVRNATSSGFLPEERAWVTKFLEHQFIDSYRFLNPDARNQYTWWSFRSNARAKNLGWRIDYHMITENLSDQLRTAGIYMDVVHSDHCPLYVTLDF